MCALFCMYAHPRPPPQPFDIQALVVLSHTCQYHMLSSAKPQVPKAGQAVTATEQDAAQASEDAHHSLSGSQRATHNAASPAPGS
eukprot:4569102-Prorocentrum_lima.AAC.1